MIGAYPQEARGATEARGFLAFIVNLLAAFTHVDPRVITQQERHSGRTALRF
jgi:hypothetical protein